MKSLLGPTFAVAATVALALAFHRWDVGHTAGSKETQANHMAIDSAKVARVTGRSPTARVEQEHRAAEREREAYVQASDTAIESRTPERRSHRTQ